jgi:hypothetical protein
MHMYKFSSVGHLDHGTAHSYNEYPTAITDALDVRCRDIISTVHINVTRW